MTTQRSENTFWLGIRDGLPFLLVIIPFGGLFGVVATEAGLDIWATIGFSVAVLAGAAQFSAVSLLEDHAPVAMVLLTSLAINLRMAMYSASLTPYLGKAPLWKRAFVAYFMVDQAYASAQNRYDERQDWTVPQRLSYYWGVILPLCPMWYIASVLGALMGNQLPASVPLDFALPITFLAMLAPMMRTIPHVVTATSAVILGLLFMNFPNGLGTIIAGILAMIIGAECARRVENHQAKQTVKGEQQ